MLDHEVSRLTSIEIDSSRLGAADIKRLCAEALDSSAVNHPYLDSIRNGDFPNIDWALKDFAFQYGVYSAQFIRYVSAVINNLSNPEHRQILQTNLDEEKGEVHDVALPAEVLATVTGQPHMLLFSRFQEALGVDAEYRKNIAPSDTALFWSDEFLKLCKMNQYVGVGAIGIGTELIVSSIYNQILKGLKAHSDLTMTQRVFFDLHSQCDDDHAAQLILIAEDLAVDPNACKEIEHGVNMAIKLRTLFWDNMLERARNCSTSDFPATEKESNVGYRKSL